MLPVLALLFSVLMTGSRAAADQLAAQDAARVAARAAARGESGAEVERLARQVAPPGSTITIGRADQLLRVQVTVRVRPLGAGLAWLPTITVSGVAVATPEPAPVTP